MKVYVVTDRNCDAYTNIVLGRHAYVRYPCGCMRRYEVYGHCGIGLSSRLTRRGCRWHPPPDDRFIAYGPEDEVWMWPLGLGRIVKCTINHPCSTDDAAINGELVIRH